MIDKRWSILFQALWHAVTTFHPTITLKYKKYPDGWYKVYKAECDKCGKVFK